MPYGGWGMSLFNCLLCFSNNIVPEMMRCGYDILGIC